MDKVNFNGLFINGLVCKFLKFGFCLIVVCFFCFGFVFNMVLVREYFFLGIVLIKFYLDWVIKKVIKFCFNNGMKFIVLEWYNVFVIFFVIYVDVGGVNELDGKIGVVYYLEYLVFKGIKKIGIKDYEVEKFILDKLD